MRNQKVEITSAHVKEMFGWDAPTYMQADAIFQEQDN